MKLDKKQNEYISTIVRYFLEEDLHKGMNEFPTDSRTDTREFYVDIPIPYINGIFVMKVVCYYSSVFSAEPFDYEDGCSHSTLYAREWAQRIEIMDEDSNIIEHSIIPHKIEAEYIDKD